MSTEQKSNEQVLAQVEKSTAHLKLAVDARRNEKHLLLAIIFIAKRDSSPEMTATIKHLESLADREAETAALHEKLSNLAYPGDETVNKIKASIGE